MYDFIFGNTNWNPCFVIVIEMNCNYSNHSLCEPNSAVYINAMTLSRCDI